MTQNGKGSKGRPLSVDKDTFDTRHEATFGHKVPWWERRSQSDKDDTCEYSGLPSTQSYDDPTEAPFEYIAVRNSGMFFEFYPGLTGNWEEDCTRWLSTKR
jgi:hypothetical protein